MSDPFRPRVDSKDYEKQREQRMLAGKRSQLRERQDKLEQERALLLNKLRKVESELEEMAGRLETIDANIGDDTLTEDTEDFTGQKPAQNEEEPGKLADLPPSEAAAILLSEAGGYLTDTQMRQGLKANGLPVDNTDFLRQELDKAAQSGAPLMKMTERLWGRAEWAEEARTSLPHKFRAEKDEKKNK